MTTETETKSTRPAKAPIAVCGQKDKLDRVLEAIRHCHEQENLSDLYNLIDE